MWDSHIHIVTEPRGSTVNPLLSTPQGLIHFKHIWGGGVIREGVLFNLAKTMVSVLPKELECKVEKLKFNKLEVMQPRIEKTNLTFQWVNKASK